MRNPGYYLELVSHELIVPYTGKKRRIRLLLPKDYHRETEHYPVVYMHDGQNVFYSKEAFAGHSWKAIKAVKDHPDLPKMILVGIDNDGEERLNEYSPFPFENMKSEENISPCGASYAAFVADMVKPFVDTNYRTLRDRTYTAMVGSSCGASVTQYTAARYPHLFGQLGIFSSANWLYQQAFDEFFASVEPHSLAGQAVFLQVGTHESNEGDASLVRGNIGQMYIDTTLRYFRQLLEKGVSLGDIELKVVVGGKHTESVWAKYFLQSLRFFSGYWNLPSLKESESRKERETQEKDTGGGKEGGKCL